MADDDWGAMADNMEKESLAKKVQSISIGGPGRGGGRGRGAGFGIGAVSPTKPAPVVGQTTIPEPQTPPTNVDAAGEPEDEDKPNKAEASLINKLLRNKLVTSITDLEVQQKDPNSPLYSVKTFEALHLKPDLLKGVYEMGFNAPSKIQETALPQLLADPPQNMIAQSQSGTGKTAAFVLTMLSRVDSSQQYPQCLCLAPTYELAVQIGDVIKQMAKHMLGLSVRYAVRGERVTRGEKLPDQIVIGTPGTMLDWCLKHRVLDLQKIKVFVLDEADVMIDTQGHQDQSIRIQRNLKESCQMLLFSATYDERVMKFAQAIVPDPVIIRLRREEESLVNIKQYYIVCQSKEEKFQALSNIYGAISIGQSMIFCHTRKTASWLAEAMTREGHAVALLSGDLVVEQRAAVISRFRDGKEKVLITTNVSARGIDVEQVTVVVNFDLPVDLQGRANCETYLHRIGRTGRFGKNGIAINMVDGNRSMRNLEIIEKHFDRKIEKLDTDDVEAIEQIAEENWN